MASAEGGMAQAMGADGAEILDDRHPGPRRPRLRLHGRQKAAIIVRALLAEGARVPLSTLPEHVQAALTEQIGTMRLVDRDTLEGVVEEFMEEVQAAGLAFPGGIDGAISMLDGHISATAANRLRRLAGVSAKSDPWERIAAMPAARLLPLLERESVEVGAVMLSKLSAARSAELLAELAGDKARRVAHAMARTGRIDPETVRRIGVALAAQLDAQPHPAFEEAPGHRVGAILNSSPATIRESVLEGLAEADPDFAEEVRRAIFTFADITDRIAESDVPRLARAVEQGELVRALVAAGAGSEREQAARDFLLDHLPQRAAESLRQEIAEQPPVPARDSDAAMGRVVDVVRRLEEAGDITLIHPED